MFEDNKLNSEKLQEIVSRAGKIHGKEGRVIIDFNCGQCVLILGPESGIEDLSTRIKNIYLLTRNPEINIEVYTAEEYRKKVMPWYEPSKLS